MFDQVVVRFGEAAEPGLRLLVATALGYEGVAYGQFGQLEQAAGMFDQVVARFGEAAEPELREQVARALVAKGYVLTGLGRLDEAAAVLDVVVTRFSEASEPTLREQVTAALRIKAEIGRLCLVIPDFLQCFDRERHTRSVFLMIPWIFREA